MTEPVEPPTQSNSESHSHVATPPTSRGWKTAAIILAIIVGIAVVVGLTLFIVGQTNQPAPSPEPSPTETATPTPSPTPTPTETAVAGCDTSNSSVTLGEPDGTAGASIVPVIFTNTGSAPCTLEGFAIVEFVDAEDGAAIGAPATEDTSLPVTLVTIEPGKTALAQLTVTTADVDGCNPTPAAGLQITPPGSNDHVFIETEGYQACDNASAEILKVTAIAAN